MRRLLMTGFEPFGGDDINPASLAVARMEGEHSGDLEVSTLQLPAVFEEAAEAVIAAAEDARPDIIISVGQAGAASEIRVERLAVNIRDARIADNAGNLPRDVPIIPEGPAAYWSTLPTRTLVEDLLEAGIPASVSYSAGAFVCNDVFYSTLHRATLDGWATRVGFIHVPLLPRQASERRDRRLPSMSLDTVVEALRVTLDTLAHH